MDQKARIYGEGLDKSKLERYIYLEVSRVP